MRIAHLVPLALCLFAASAGAQPSPPVPSAVIDLRSPAGVESLHAQWRYTDAEIVQIEFPRAGADRKPSGAAGVTHDIQPRIDSADFDRADWSPVAADDLETRRSGGRLSFGWYRLDLVVPERVGSFDVAGSDIVLEVVVDDYAEVWVNRRAPFTLGQSAGPLIAGWNTPMRVNLARNAQPGARIEVAIFAANGPLSQPPANYIWIRSATLDFYKPGVVAAHAAAPTVITRLDPALDEIISPGAQAEKLADGLGFGEGPVWIPSKSADSAGSLLFSDPNQNVIHRWDPLTDALTIFRTKSGYSGVGGADIGAYHQPGSNGLALDPHGRLTICEHGNRRVTRLEPNGDLTVLAERFEGRRLNSPNDLVYRSDGALFFTDPPFGLPRVFDDPAKELPHSGVYCLLDGRLRLVSAELTGPNGLAFSPDESVLYVDNWDERRKVVMRYEVAPDGSLSNGSVFVDLTSEPGEICFDGLKVDRRGNVFVSAPGGVRIFAPDGRPLGIISPPELPANFAFGDDDRQTLYMTARAGLYRIRLNTPGPAR